jgi:hypothetical protein
VVAFCRRSQQGRLQMLQTSCVGTRIPTRWDPRSKVPFASFPLSAVRRAITTDVAAGFGPASCGATRPGPGGWILLVGACRVGALQRPEGGCSRSRASLSRLRWKASFDEPGWSVVADPLFPEVADALDVHEVGVLIGGLVRRQLDLCLVLSERHKARGCGSIKANPDDASVARVEPRLQASSSTLLPSAGMVQAVRARKISLQSRFRHGRHFWCADHYSLSPRPCKGNGNEAVQKREWGPGCGDLALPSLDVAPLRGDQPHPDETEAQTEKVDPETAA